jgi:hypothetical protein
MNKMIGVVRKTVGWMVLSVGFFGFAAVIQGCQQDSPSEPVSSAPSVTPSFLELPAPSARTLKKQVTASAFITVAQGGTLELHDNYIKADGHRFRLDISLELQPGAMPYDADLTMSVDDSLFVSTLEMTYGPHGIVFNKPARLSVTATGLDLDGASRRLKLYYIENDVWTEMPASNAIYYAGDLWGHGKLPHFSKYGFARVD